LQCAEGRGVAAELLRNERAAGVPHALEYLHDGGVERVGRPDDLPGEVRFSAAESTELFPRLPQHAGELLGEELEELREVAFAHCGRLIAGEDETGQSSPRADEEAVSVDAGRAQLMVQHLDGRPSQREVQQSEPRGHSQHARLREERIAIDPREDVTHCLRNDDRASVQRQHLRALTGVERQPTRRLSSGNRAVDARVRDRELRCEARFRVRVVRERVLSDDGVSDRVEDVGARRSNVLSREHRLDLAIVTLR